MTHEEAKALGATHYDHSGDYWKVISDTESYFYCLLDKKWIRYAFNHNEDIENGHIKPL